jgi:integrase
MITNPTHGITKLRVEKDDKKENVLSYEQVKRLLYVGVVSDPEIMPFLILRFLTGIRKTHIHGLDWEQIQLKNKRLIVYAVTAKKRKRHIVPLTDNAIEWLKHYERDKGKLLVASQGLSGRAQPIPTGDPCPRLCRSEKSWLLYAAECRSAHFHLNGY